MARVTWLTGLLLATTWIASPAVAEDDEVEQSIQRVSDFMEAINDELYRPAFDLDALLNELAFDESEIFQFVRDDVAYEVYPGVMRGALGTLLSRSGNAADQAVLLAKLLRDAGFDARIARANLDEAQAKQVLGAMRRDISPPPPIGDASAMLDILGEWQGGDAPLSDEQIAAYKDYIAAPYRVGGGDGSEAAALAKVSKQIQAAMDAAGARFDTSALDRALVEDARDYFWVQTRASASSDWDDLHPVFQEEAPLPGLTASQHITDDIPEDLLHKLRFQVFVEKTQGEDIEALAITAPWERPIANLVGVPLTFTNIADSMLNDGARGKDFETLLGEARMFAPGFGTEMAPGGRFFDYRASLIDPFAAASPAGGLFATLGDSLAEATLGVDEDAAVPRLTAQWIEFTLVSPSGEERAFRRMTMDRIGANARASGKPPEDLDLTDHDDVRALVRRHTFMVQVGEIARGYVVDSAYRQFLESRPGIAAGVSIARGGDASAGDMAGLPAGWPGHLALFTVLDSADGIGTQHRNYRSGPALVVHTEGLGDPGEWVEAIDIVTNPRRAVSLSGDLPAIDPVAALESGIWETGVEGVLMEGDTYLNTETVFDSAREAGIDTVAVGDRNGLDTTGYGADTRAAMAADINRGYVLVMPERPPAEDMIGWWRVDPASGESLGQIADGRGSVSVETVIGHSISAFALGYGLAGCSGLSGKALACCGAANVGLAAFTFGIGLKMQEGAMALIAGLKLDINRMFIPVAEVCDAAF